MLPFLMGYFFSQNYCYRCRVSSVSVQCIQIALNKPSGVQVLSGGLFQQRTVLTQLQGQASKHSSSLARQEPHPVPVHRLGRGTSGKPEDARNNAAELNMQTCYFPYNFYLDLVYI